MKWLPMPKPRPACGHCWHPTLPEGAYDPNPDKCCKCGHSRQLVARPIPEGHGKYMPKTYELEP